MPSQGAGIVDGSLDWSGGVNSVLVPTIASAQNPNGLQRNMLAWLDNATVRDGGITPRGGNSLLGTVHDSSGLFQGKFMYDPLNANPYIITALNGHIYQVLPGPPFQVIDLSAKFNLFMPATWSELFFFAQAEQFLVIQVGDFVTLPLFWDGTTLRRSKGITNTAVAPGTPGVNEIPSAGPMVYYMGRLWYAIGRTANAGDIVKGPSGTAQYQFTDSVLNVTECPLVVGGDGFTVPVEAGNIRALFVNATVNSQLGQGQLLIGTRKTVSALTVPISRADWISTTNQTQPLLTVVQLTNGPVNDKSVVLVNGDAYFQSLEPSIRSLLASLRYWNQPGNISISNQENRVLQFNNRALLRFGSGIEFGNRLLETSLPLQLPQGVIHQAVLPLDFVPMSTYGSNQQPIWEGMYEGLQVLQLTTGDFGGLQRAFALTVSQNSQSLGQIQLWELSEFQKFDSNAFDTEARITWYAEFPAFTWGDEFQLKRLETAELWVDRVFGTVIFKMEYRPDGETCWLPWHEWQICSAKSSCEDVTNPVCYPITPYGEGYKATMTLPDPARGAQCETANKRPSNIGYQFQVKLTVKGFCRIRGLLLYADKLERKMYEQLVCSPAFSCPATPSELPSASTPPVLSDLSTTSGQAGNPFSASVTAAGQAPFTLSASFVNGSNGLTFSQTDQITGVISGTPSTSGTFTVTITAKDKNGLTTSRSYVLTMAAAPGVSIQSYATVLAALGAFPGGCTASGDPAWNGTFDQFTTNPTTGNGGIWYFLHKSINGQCVAANCDPLYPAGDWQDNGTFTQLFWFPSGGGQWHLEITCQSTGDIWFGAGSTNFNDARGTYPRGGGSSAGPASITIV